MLSQLKPKVHKETLQCRDRMCAANTITVFFFNFGEIKRSNKTIVRMHMHIVERTNDWRKKKREKNSTNTDYKANAHYGRAYADFRGFFCNVLILYT